MFPIFLHKEVGEMADKECPYLIDNSTFSVKRGKCSIDNNACVYVRFCSTRNKIVSSPLYGNCGCSKQRMYESEK